MEINKRLKELRLKLGFTQIEFANALNMKQGSYSDVERGRVGVSNKIIQQLERDHGVRPIWLEKGEGTMLIDGDPLIRTELHGITNSLKKILAEAKPVHVIKYYDIESSASPVEMFKDKNKIEYQNLCVPGFNDCTIALNVWGDSMLPILKSGEIVMLKEWNESFIEYGHIYMIVTKNNHRMIKYIQPDKSEESVLCESANDFYKPFPIKKEDILKLYVVKGHIERNAI